MNTIEAQLARIYEAIGCSTHSKLAEILGIKQSAVTDAIRRNEIPKVWLERLYQEWGISPEWILTGDSETKYLINEDPINATDEVVQNEAHCTAAEEKTCEHCDDPLSFAMRDNYHEFSMGLFTVLQCLRLAETEGHVPLLPEDWWVQLAVRYNLRL